MNRVNAEIDSAATKRPRTTRAVRDVASYCAFLRNGHDHIFQHQMLLSAMLLRTGIEGPIAMNNLHGSQNFFGAISLGFLVYLAIGMRRGIG